MALPYRPTTSTLNVDYNVGGTPISGTNYTALSSTVTFAQGQSYASMTVTPKEDNKADPTLTVTAVLIHDAGFSYNIAVGYMPIRLPDSSPLRYTPPRDRAGFTGGCRAELPGNIPPENGRWASCWDDLRNPRIRHGVPLLHVDCLGGLTAGDFASL